MTFIGLPPLFSALAVLLIVALIVTMAAAMVTLVTGQKTAVTVAVFALFIVTAAGTSVAVAHSSGEHRAAIQARIASIEEVYGVTLSEGAYRELGYPETAPGAGREEYWVAIAENSKGKAVAVRLVGNDGELMLVRDESDAELPRR